MTNPADGIPAELIGRNVVLDLSSPYVCVGVLEGADHHYLILVEADLHDLRDSKTTREHYLVQCQRVGVRVNRQRVYVRREDVVSLSARCRRRLVQSGLETGSEFGWPGSAASGRPRRGGVNLGAEDSPEPPGFSGTEGASRRLRRLPRNSKTGIPRNGAILYGEIAFEREDLAPQTSRIDDMSCDDQTVEARFSGNRTVGDVDLASKGGFRKGTLDTGPWKPPHA